MLVYRELQTFTRILIDNLIYDLGIMAIVYEIWNNVGPPGIFSQVHMIGFVTNWPPFFIPNKGGQVTKPI